MIRHLERITVAMVALAITASGAAFPALASQPDRVRLPVDDTFPSRTSEECGFEILLHLEGSMVFTDHVNRDGDIVRSLVTYPRLFYTFINAQTGESVTSRSPDPEHYTWNADGSVTLAVTGLVLHLLGPGQTGQSVQAGRFIVTIDADGNVSEAEPAGRSEDYHAALCEILAP